MSAFTTVTAVVYAQEFLVSQIFANIQLGTLHAYRSIHSTLSFITTFGVAF